MKLVRLLFAVSLAGLFSACPVAVGADGSTEVTGTIPLVASNIAASGITSSGATVSWDTNGNATSQVFYDTSAHANTSDYTFSTAVNANLAAIHNIGLTELTAGTTYHYRVKSEIPATTFSDVSVDYTFTTLVSTGGGGGGGGGGFGSQLVGIGLSGTSPFMDGNGRAITAGLVRTADGSLSLSVPVGTYVWNTAGAAQSFLSATPLTAPPQAPPQQSLVLAFEMGPTGVTFNPAISLVISYTDAQIPAGTNEADLYIAWWDGAKWVKLTGTVDAAANTITVSVSHFTSFALLAPAAPPPPPAPTLKINTPATGASFDPGSVNVSISAGNLKLVHGDNLPKVPGEGCIVYYLDVTIPTTPGQSALSATGTFKESIDISNAWANLTPGSHTLGVQLVQNDHTPFNPPVYSSVSVTIKEPPPPQTTATPVQPTLPPLDQTTPNWSIIVLFLTAALALVVFLFWKMRKPADKLQYTNRK